MSGARTPLGHYSSSQTSEFRRPRSSIGGSYSSHGGHGHSQSVSVIEFDERGEEGLSTPRRRDTIGRGDDEGTGIPTPSALPRRKSGGINQLGAGRRTSSGGSGEGMRPPTGQNRPRKLSEVGETY